MNVDGISRYQGCTLPISIASSLDLKGKKEIASWDASFPSHAYKPQQVIQSESFYHSTEAPLQVFMATSHDSLLYQPEGDTGWSCGTFTVVKILESLLQLERNGETKFFGCRAQFRLENCNWKQLDGMVVSSDHVGFPSKVPHVKKMVNFFALEPLKFLTNKENVQIEEAVVAFSIKKVVQNLIYELENVE